MTATQYIGARYVPKFADPTEWDNTKAYESLTIVLHEGNSYTSRQAVPVGADISNETYWAETGNYNAQVETYRKEVLAVESGLNEIKDKISPFNIAKLGAKPNDSSVDVGEFINKAVELGYEYIFIPEGVWYQYSEVELSNTKMIEGCATVIECMSNIDVMFTITGNVADDTEWCRVVNNITFHGNGKCGTAVKCKLWHSLIKNCSFTQFTKVHLDLYKGSNVFNCWLQNCFTKAGGETFKTFPDCDGINLDSDSQVIGCRLWGFRRALVFEELAYGSFVTSCVFFSQYNPNPASAIYCNSSGWNPYPIKVSQCEFDNIPYVVEGGLAVDICNSTFMYNDDDNAKLTVKDFYIIHQTVDNGNHRLINLHDNFINPAFSGSFMLHFTNLDKNNFTTGAVYNNVFPENSYPKHFDASLSPLDSENNIEIKAGAQWVAIAQINGNIAKSEMGYYNEVVLKLYQEVAHNNPPYSEISYGISNDELYVFCGSSLTIEDIALYNEGGVNHKLWIKLPVNSPTNRFLPTSVKTASTYNAGNIMVAPLIPKKAYSEPVGTKVEYTYTNYGSINVNAIGS